MDGEDMTSLPIVSELPTPEWAAQTLSTDPRAPKGQGQANMAFP